MTANSKKLVQMQLTERKSDISIVFLVKMYLAYGTITQNDANDFYTQLNYTDNKTVYEVCDTLLDSGVDFGIAVGTEDLEVYFDILLIKAEITQVEHDNLVLKLNGGV